MISVRCAHGALIAVAIQTQMVLRTWPGISSDTRFIDLGPAEPRRGRHEARRPRAIGAQGRSPRRGIEQAAPTSCWLSTTAACEAHE